MSENDLIELEIVATGLNLQNFTSYRFTEHFLQPSDSWEFAIGGESVTQKLLAQLAPGLRVRLKINGHIQSTGYVDAVNVRSDRNGGMEVTINGRDWLSPAVDACIDPYNTKFNAGQSLLDVVREALGPFGVRNFSAHNDANKNVITGQPENA